MPLQWFLLKIWNETDIEWETILYNLELFSPAIIIQQVFLELNN